MPVPQPSSPRSSRDPHAASARPSLLAAEHLDRNVDKVAAIHLRAEEGLNAHQRRIERVTLAIGRPRSLYAMIVLAGAWAAANLVAKHPVDPAPFFWLQGVVAFLGLLVTTMVLTTQNRLEKLADQRSHLELQVNLLAEQKIAKLIALVEELRRDLPDVPHRVDHVAQSMTKSVVKEPGWRTDHPHFSHQSVSAA